MKEIKVQQIVELLKAKDSNGLKLLLKHYKPFMYYIIAPILPNSHDQEDCISEISIRIWEKIYLYDIAKGNFLSWFTAFVKNTALNQARKKAKHPDYEQLKEIEDVVPSSSLSPEEAYLKNEREEQLLAALNQLKPADRLLFYRKYYYMQSTQQIALEYGTTVRAIEGKLYRIKKQLRKILGGDFNER